jgi:DNA-binding response OmpR family regulator
MRGAQTAEERLARARDLPAVRRRGLLLALRDERVGVRVVDMRLSGVPSTDPVASLPQPLAQREALPLPSNLMLDGHDRQARVLIVEDDEDIAQVLQRSLRLEGYDTRVAADGEAALKAAAEFIPDLVILDLGLPKIDGMDVARQLRAEGDVPILMLTARDAVESRVAGLDAGADDYLVKPFERQELLARMRALLRRRPPRGSASLVVGDLSLNPDTHEVRRGDREIKLTQREFELLEYLMRNERIVISRQRLLEDVWGYDPFATTNTIEVFVSNLRRKLEAGGEPRLLHTIRGAGYVLRA